MTKLVLIAARDANSVIGFNGGLPWSIPEDLAFFKRTTLGMPVIMGRKTHESIGFALPGRENIVITSKATRYFKGCITATSLDAALAYCEHHEQDEAYVIGGATIYQQAMPLASKLILTEISHEFKGDTYFPPVDMNKWVVTERVSQRSALEPHYVFSFVTYERREDVAQREQDRRNRQLVTDFHIEKQGTEMIQHYEQGALDIKKYKHPGHIFAIDKDFTDNLPGMGLQHGLTALTATEYAQWLALAGAETVIRQRDGLELNPAYRQILPYTIVAFSDDELEKWSDIEVQSYQRTKKVGEERLGGKFSVGFGGHIDKADVVSDDKSIVNLKETIQRNVEREVGFEELRFVTAEGLEVNPTDHPELFRFAHLGFIRDDSNNVGKVHLGLVNIIFVPRSFTVSVKEDELKDGPRLTFEQLKESDLDFENWSRILIDDMSGSEPTVFPAEVRKPSYDMFTCQYFIEAAKGDKLGDIAIEFNTTVRKLLRLNVHLNESHVGGIVVGTRVNVPEQPSDMGEMIKVEVQEECLTPSNSTEEERQAAMTAAVLKLVKQTSPDYQAHGLRYLVTDQMLERLLDIDPELSALVQGGIIQVVELDPHDPDPATVAEFVRTYKSVPPEFPKGTNTSMDAPEDNTGVQEDAGAALLVDERAKTFKQLPNPTEADLEDPVFNALWNEIKSWDVNAPAYYVGYCGANGSHVKLLLNALKEAGICFFIDVEAGFHRAVRMGEENGTARHVLENGDSINSICEKYGISKEDFERWNGFEQGHAWPTHTGYVFIQDPAATRPEEPTLPEGWAERTRADRDSLHQQYEEPTL